MRRFERLLGRRVRGVDSQGFPSMIGRFLVFASVKMSGGQIRMGVGVIGLNANGSAECGDPLLRLTQSEEHVPKALVSVGKARLDA